MKLLARQQSGFSLVQGMIISAVLAGSALIATRLMSTQKLAQKAHESKNSIDQLNETIFSILQNRDHCSETFAGTTFTPNSSLSIQNIKNKGSVTSAFEENKGLTSYNAATTYMNGMVRINSINLKTGPTFDALQELHLNYATLEGKVDPNKRTGSGFGGKSVTKIIHLKLQRLTAASNAISSCYAVVKSSGPTDSNANENLNEEFCSNLGEGGSLYTWDSARNTCVLNNLVCPDRQVFVGINSNGTADCRPITDYLPSVLTAGSNPCPDTKTQVRLVKDPITNLVSIECSGVADPTDNLPTNLTLTHTNRNRLFYVSWTAGSANGDCRIEYDRNGSWSPLSGVYSCDANMMNAPVELPTNASWITPANWVAGISIRLVRISDSSAMGTFPQKPICSSTTAGSSTATPNVDENCNTQWDDNNPCSFTCTAAETGGSFAPGNSYNFPATKSCGGVSTNFSSVSFRTGILYNAWHTSSRTCGDPTPSNHAGISIIQTTRTGTIPTSLPANHASWPGLRLVAPLNCAAHSSSSINWSYRLTSPLTAFSGCTVTYGGNLYH